MVNYVLCGVDTESVETVIDGHTENTILVSLHCLGFSVHFKFIMVGEERRSKARVTANEMKPKRESMGGNLSQL